MGVLISLGNHRRGDFDRQFEAEELPWRWKLDTDELALTWQLKLAVQYVPGHHLVRITGCS